MLNKIQSFCRPLFVPSFVLAMTVVYFTAMQVYVTNSTTSILFHTYFIERDPALSAPYVAKQQVPMATLQGLCGGLTQIALLLSIAIYFYQMRHKEHKVKKVLQYALLIYIGFGVVLMLTMAISNTIKIWIASPRPNFFALCNYQGYREALETGNYSHYLANTEAGRLGDPKYCLAPLASVNDAFMSFPSVHSSMMFCTTVYVSAVLFVQRMTNPVVYGGSVVVSAGYFVISAWVVATRVVDYLHRTQDVFAGMFLGSIVGVAVFTLIRDNLKKYELLFKYEKLEDDKEVKI